MNVRIRSKDKGSKIRDMLTKLGSNVDVIPYITFKFLSEKQEKNRDNLEEFQKEYGFTFRDYELLSNIIKKHEKEDESYVSDIHSAVNALKYSNNRYIKEIFNRISDESITKDILDNILTILEMEEDNVVELYHFVNYVQSNENEIRSSKAVTPPFIELLGDLINVSHEPNNVYDPSCNDAQTVTALKKFNHATLYEKDEDTYYNIIQNMIINEIPLDKISVEIKEILVDESTAKYDTILSIPYPDKYIDKSKIINNPNIEKFKTKKYNSIHLLNLIEHLDDDGILITTTSQDLLVKKDAYELRKCLIEKNILDTVIEYETGFRSRDITILIIKKNKKTDDFLFMKPQQILPGLMLPDSLEKIKKSYENREVYSKFSNLIDKEDIIKNEYNLNPKRYVYTLDYEVKSIEEILNQQEEYKNKINSLDEEISQLLDELKE